MYSSYLHLCLLSEVQSLLFRGISRKNLRKINFIAKFSTNSSSQGKHSPTNPQMELSVTGMIFKHGTTRHILDGLSVNKAAEPDGIQPLRVFKRCATVLTRVLYQVIKYLENSNICIDRHYVIKYKMF